MSLDPNIAAALIGALATIVSAIVITFFGKR